MAMRRKTVVGLTGRLWVLVLAGVMAPGMQAQARCSESALSRFAPSAHQAVVRWATERKVAVPQLVRADVADTFCSAAVDAATYQRVPDDAIGRVAEAVIARYLDLSLDTTQPMHSMESLLNTALGASGLARPVPRYLVRITLTYEGAPEQIRIGAEVMPPLSTLMWRAGPFMVTGLRDKHEVCRGESKQVMSESALKNGVKVTCNRT